jgi:acetyl-CoA carboxylase carboxyltransferase component
MTYDIEKQHQKGKLHAIERINALLDEDSFVEIYSAAKHSNPRFGMAGKEIPYDGVITGFGTIKGRHVAIYAQDFTVSGGSLGKMHGQKIADIVERAIDARCPIIGINDSGGARIQEGVDSLAGYGDIMFQNVRASGYIPQISIIAGPCAGGAVYSPGITDFIFAVDNISYMFITGPKVVKSVMFQDITEEALGGAVVHSQKSGVCAFRLATELGCYALVKKLLDYIPHYYGEKRSPVPFAFAKARKYRDIEALLPGRSSQGYDIRRVIDCVIDDDTFLEVFAEFAPNVVIGFGRIAGKTVGIVANNPGDLGGIMNCDASDKAARFVRYCDAFDVPLLTFVDIPGFIPGPDEEQKGIIRHGAKLIYAYSEATVPKVTVITRKAYGGAYIAMCSRHLGADFVFAWPDSEIAVMGAEGAVEILYAKEIRSGTMSGFVQQKIAEYRSEMMSPRTAAERGYVSEVIWPVGTRKKVAAAFAFLENKRPPAPLVKKHGNIPL